MPPTDDADVHSAAHCHLAHREQQEPISCRPSDLRALRRTPLRSETPCLRRTPSHGVGTTPWRSRHTPWQSWKGVPASDMTPQATTHQWAARAGHPARAGSAPTVISMRTYHPNATFRQGEMPKFTRLLGCFAHHGQQEALNCRLPGLRALRRTPCARRQISCLRRTSPLGVSHAPRTRGSEAPISPSHKVGTTP